MRRHVVLTTYGEPPTPAFLDQLAYSWRILLGLTRRVDAIPRPLLPLIALARAWARSRAWRRESYGSPLEAVSGRQAHALSVRLRRQAPAAHWKVHVAYEYRHPLVGDVLARLPAEDPVWVLPLYVADSAFTHELAREAAAARRGPTCVLGALAPAVIGELSAAHVRAGTAIGGWSGPDVALVLAAHGTVLNPPGAMATGREATEAVCADIRARLGGRFGLIANGWLNHTRGGKWTEPAIEEVLREVSAAGYRRVVYFPCGFLGDNAESQLEGRLALAARPELTVLHIECLNDHPALIDVLATQVLTCEQSCRPGAAVSASCGRSCQPTTWKGTACTICAAADPGTGAVAGRHAANPAYAG